MTDKITLRAQKGAELTFAELDGNFSIVELLVLSLTAALDLAGTTARTLADRNVLLRANTPASASDPGDPGQVCWDEDYIYVCTAPNTWCRAAISIWSGG